MNSTQIAIKSVPTAHEKFCQQYTSEKILQETYLFSILEKNVREGFNTTSSNGFLSV